MFPSLKVSKATDFFPFWEQKASVAIGDFAVLIASKNSVPSCTLGSLFPAKNISQGNEVCLRTLVMFHF